MLVDLDKNKTSDDELDAIAIALTAFAHLRGITRFTCKTRLWRIVLNILQVRRAGYPF